MTTTETTEAAVAEATPAKKTSTKKPASKKPAAAKAVKAAKSNKTTAPAAKTEAPAEKKLAQKRVGKGGGKADAAEKVAPAKSSGGLAGNQLLVLKALKGTSSGGKELTRHDLAEATKISKGWSKLLGSATKEEVGGMEGDGLIKSSKHEGSRALTYYITAKGTKVLGKNS